jgi:hypothetical protein
MIIYTQMTTRTTTTALILAAFALVGLTTTGVVPAAFAQTPVSGVGGLLDRILGPEDNDNATDGTNGADGTGTETETETETTEQSGDQSETNVQSNSLDQDQTAAINEEIASGEGSSASSNAESNAESNYKTKYKSSPDSSSISGTNTSNSSATSEVSNIGAIDQDQTLNDPVQVNDNDFGSDDSRAAVVGFDLEFEQSLEEEHHP